MDPGTSGGGVAANSAFKVDGLLGFDRACGALYLLDQLYPWESFCVQLVMVRTPEVFRLGSVVVTIMLDKSKDEADCEVMREEQIDEALKETFPASDPPAWTLGIENQCNTDPDREDM